jgi:hypothetical protein
MFRFVLFIAAILCFSASFSQKTKFDTTVRWDKIAYKVSCNNKNPDKNIVSISTYGFTGEGRNNIAFEINGKVVKAAIDDFNSDGYPDLIFYSYDMKDRAQVYALASSENKYCIPIFMNDIYGDSKIREGYQGHDEFTVMDGLLSRKFPVYKMDSTSKEIKIVSNRIVQYKVDTDKTNPDRPVMRFKVLRSYEIKND